MDKQFLDAAVSKGIDTNPADFTSLSLGAMMVLKENGKPNLIHTWAKCVYGEDGKPLMPVNRMPFGLIQYQMQFFTATNVMQVSRKSHFVYVVVVIKLWFKIVQTIDFYFLLF